MEAGPRLAVRGIIGAASRASMRSDEDAAAARDSRAKAFALLERALAELDERDRRIVELHYREGHELREVATMVGVSYATVRRYHAGALDRLGARLRGGGLKARPSPASGPARLPTPDPGADTTSPLAPRQLDPRQLTPDSSTLQLDPPTPTPYRRRPLDPPPANGPRPYQRSPRLPVTALH